MWKKEEKEEKRERERERGSEEEENEREDTLNSLVRTPTYPEVCLFG